MMQHVPQWILDYKTNPLTYEFINTCVPHFSEYINLYRHDMTS